jgi:hypothetical protein
MDFISVFAHSFSSVSAKTTCQAPAGFNLFFFFIVESIPLPAISSKYLLTQANTGLHLPSTREWLAMRKQFGMAAQWIVFPLIASLASCQSGRNGGAAGSKTEITDPNTAFSQGGANANSGTGPASGNSSRRGRNLFGGSDGGS